MSEIEIVGELTSKSYVEVTTDCMKRFGVVVKNNNYQTFYIPNDQEYKPGTYKIEGDASNASYFFGAAAVTKGTVRVTNLNPKSAQGDIHFPEVLERMGCKIKKGEDWIEVIGRDLNGIEVDMNIMPDTVQTLAVVASFAKGKTNPFETG